MEEDRDGPAPAEVWPHDRPTRTRNNAPSLFRHPTKNIGRWSWRLPWLYAMDRRRCKSDFCRHAGTWSPDAACRFHPLPVIDRHHAGKDVTHGNDRRIEVSAPEGMALSDPGDVVLWADATPTRRPAILPISMQESSTIPLGTPVGKDDGGL